MFARGNFVSIRLVLAFHGFCILSDNPWKMPFLLAVLSQIVSDITLYDCPYQNVI